MNRRNSTIDADDPSRSQIDRNENTSKTGERLHDDEKKIIIKGDYTKETTSKP